MTKVENSLGEENKYVTFWSEMTIEFCAKNVFVSVQDTVTSTPS